MFNYFAFNCFYFVEDSKNGGVLALIFKEETSAAIRAMQQFNELHSDKTREEQARDLIERYTLARLATKYEKWHERARYLSQYIQK
jgi:hypothetical protein